MNKITVCPKFLTAEHWALYYTTRLEDQYVYHVRYGGLTYPR